MGEKSMATFEVKSIIIGDKSIDSNGVVEITKSHIQFYVSSVQSPTPIQVKIYGAHMHSLCFNFWCGRGTIAFFIDADAAKTAFGDLVDAQILSDWHLSHAGISFGVTGIYKDVLGAIVDLSKNVQLSFDCTTTAIGRGLQLSNENSEHTQSSAPHENTECNSEEPSMSIAIDAEQEEMSVLIVTSTEVNNNDQKKSVQSMEFTTTNENNVVNGGKSTTSKKRVTLGMDVRREHSAASNKRQNNGCDNTGGSLSVTHMDVEGRQNIAVRMKDLECLKPSAHLNDNVINAYLKLILSDKQEEGNVPKIQLLDNFLLTTLSRGIDMEQSYSVASNRYGLNRELCQEIAEKKKRLIEKYTIFKADFVVLPICHNDHWFMIIVCHLSKMRDVGCKILIFDSIHNSEDYYEEHLNVLLHFVVGSYIVTGKAGERDVRKFMDDLFKNIELPDVPRQSNNTDCGLYLLEYFENFLDNPDINRNWSNLIDKRIMRYKRQKVKNALKEIIEQSRSE